MSYVDLLGYVACGLVLAAFCAASILRLRILALLSNLAFIAYALLMDLTPVLVLHALLLPVNALRLVQAVFARQVALLPPGERKPGRILSCRLCPARAGICPRSRRPSKCRSGRRPRR